MTNTAILSCLAVASKGSSLKGMVEQATAQGQTLQYDSLTRFFSRPWSAEKELQEAAQSLFQLHEGWAILDEIVIAKSIESTLLASVKRRRKSAGGYVTPSIAVVVLLWSDGRQRVPLAFEYRSGPESVQELGLRLLRRLRNQFKLRPRCVLFDAGFSAMPSYTASTVMAGLSSAGHRDRLRSRANGCGNLNGRVSGTTPAS